MTKRVARGLFTPSTGIRGRRPDACLVGRAEPNLELAGLQYADGQYAEPDFVRTA